MEPPRPADHEAGPIPHVAVARDQQLDLLELVQPPVLQLPGASMARESARSGVEHTCPDALPKGQRAGLRREQARVHPLPSPARHLVRQGMPGQLVLHRLGSRQEPILDVQQSREAVHAVSIGGADRRPPPV
jgi:hypothetical protein